MDNTENDRTATEGIVSKPNARGRYTIHTTLSRDVHNIIDRYYPELGSKQDVIETALKILADGMPIAASRLDYNSGMSLSTKNITPKVTKKKQSGLNDILGKNLNRGECTYVEGPSGCGKSSLVHALGYNTILENNNQCFIFSDASECDILESLSMLGVTYGSVRSCLENNQLIIYRYVLDDINHMADVLMRYGFDGVIDPIHPKYISVVLDPINGLDGLFNSTGIDKNAVNTFKKILNANGNIFLVGETFPEEYYSDALRSFSKNYLYTDVEQKNNIHPKYIIANSTINNSSYKSAYVSYGDNSKQLISLSNFPKN